MKQCFTAVVLAGVVCGAMAQEPADDPQLRHSVEQLRSVVGAWDVVTEFLNDDGSVAKAVTGTYEFTVVVPDRVLAGRSDIAELQQTSAILFYVDAKRRHIEMTSVGADGRLWIMTGPLGEETRYTQEFDTTTGGKGQLRFTRFNVGPDAFESRMDYTEDGGATWKPGNHQVFRRRPAPAQ